MKKELSIEDKINIAKKNYNNEIVKKSMKYQKKYNFELNPKQGHEFWNNEADAFKHTFLSADLYFKYGEIGSIFGGIKHEWKTPNNPQGEWNMDSWNNNQGREIAKEIEKEYGNNFMKLPQEQRDGIIASKVIVRMRNGELITNPNDKRKYNRYVEQLFNNSKKIKENSTGFATPINNVYSKFLNYTNTVSGDNRIYTREDIGNMTVDEFAQNEQAIMSQLRRIGIPTNGDMELEAMTNGNVIYVHEYIRLDGTRVRGYYRSKAK